MRLLLKLSPLSAATARISRTSGKIERRVAASDDMSVVWGLHNNVLSVVVDLFWIIDMGSGGRSAIREQAKKIPKSQTWLKNLQVGTFGFTTTYKHDSIPAVAPKVVVACHP
jgi:hypothetical protein